MRFQMARPQVAERYTALSVLARCRMRGVTRAVDISEAECALPRRPPMAPAPMGPKVHQMGMPAMLMAQGHCCVGEDGWWGRDGVGQAGAVCFAC